MLFGLGKIIVIYLSFFVKNVVTFASKCSFVKLYVNILKTMKNILRLIMRKYRAFSFATIF